MVNELRFGSLDGRMSPEPSSFSEMSNEATANDAVEDAPGPSGCSSGLDVRNPAIAGDHEIPDRGTPRIPARPTKVLADLRGVRVLHTLPA